MASPGISTGDDIALYHEGDAASQELVAKAKCVGVMGGTDMNVFGPALLRALMHLPTDSGHAVLLPSELRGSWARASRVHQ